MSNCKSIKRLIPAACAWILLLSTTAVFFIFPCRRLQDDYHFSITIAQALITFFVISNLFATTFVDPGIIRRADPDEDKDDFRAPLYKEVQIRGHVVRMKWCPTCQFYRPPRCSHCSVCNNCIEKFDHHCPWVNNCIGRRNYRHFFFFLIFLTLHMITIFIWCMLLIVKNQNNLNETSIVVSIVLIVIISIFFIPIFGLTGFHVILVTRGRTTNEQVTRKFNRQINPFSNGCLNNCINTLCSPRYPGLYQPKSKRRKESDSNILMTTRMNESSLNEVDNAEITNRNQTRQQPPNEIALEKIDENSTDDYKTNSVSSIHHNLSQSSNIHPKVSSYRETSRNSINLDDEDDIVLNGFHNEINYRSQYNSNDKDDEDSLVVTMEHMTNGTRETTFIALPTSHSLPFNSHHTVNSTSPSTNYHRHQNPKISTSKSNSINEISNICRSPTMHAPSIQGPEGGGGILIYYSPDAGGGGYVANCSKFNSETELQKYNKTQYKYINDEPIDLSEKFTSKRPMKFQKALEISNKIEQANRQSIAARIEKSNQSNRQSQYEMNYEISV
ncbi:Palmitoyltransferase ZDHHC5 [Sarcoptes scabiei]|uniref:Palmitoyltransferase n=2 Tax=Sarcoptes scabiei TaxID=52283 RepID=A0A834QYL0_SARSC|nr:Palmitoyltransferase ZDHHC5 [Sarcoptes scabiei]